MRSLLWLVAVFAAAVALVVVGRVDAGYVLFVYPPYRVEVTMIFFAITALAGFMLLYGLARVMGQVLTLPATVRAYRARRRRERAHAALARALQAYYEGRYRRAEREAALAYETGTVPGIAALLAARAAHQLRDFAARDRWFERADSAGDAWRTARLVSRAELALAERDFGAARDALRGLEGAAPPHRGARGGAPPRLLARGGLLRRAARGAGAGGEVRGRAGQLVKRDARAPALAE